jgi:phage terminase large subunit-like protein
MPARAPSAEAINLARHTIEQFYPGLRREYPQSAWWRGGARPEQLPPEGNWYIWMLLPGRGFGKSRVLSEFCNEKARTQPGSFGMIVGATIGDARKINIYGESGILRHATDGFRPTYHPSKGWLEYPNGTIAYVVGAEDYENFRGYQCHWMVMDEFAAWRYLEPAWDVLKFCCRLDYDPHHPPQVVIATTPRPYKTVRQLANAVGTVVTHGSSYDNIQNLSQVYVNTVLKPMEGSRLAKQEIEGRFLEDSEHALWDYAIIEQHRVLKPPPEFVKFAVAIDPATTSHEESDETGIVAGGTDENGDVYILEDASMKGKPHEWAGTGVALYEQYEADAIVAETNNGGDMIESTIHNIPAEQKVHVVQVRASRGKRTRAEPIATLYRQGKVHHVGNFAKLEEQMCTWEPGMKSPDRMDALVWLVSYLTGVNHGKAPNTGMARWNGRFG